MLHYNVGRRYPGITELEQFLKELGKSGSRLARVDRGADLRYDKYCPYLTNGPPIRLTPLKLFPNQLLPAGISQQCNGLPKMVGHALPRGYEHITFVFRVVLVAVGTQYHQNIKSTWPNTRFSSLGWVRETRNAGTKLVKCPLQ